MTQHEGRREPGFLEAFRRTYQQMWTLGGAVLQNRLSEGNVKENLNCSAEGGEREFSDLVGSGAPGWVNPGVGARGVSCWFPLEAVMDFTLSL